MKTKKLTKKEAIKLAREKVGPIAKVYISYEYKVDCGIFGERTTRDLCGTEIRDMRCGELVFQATYCFTDSFHRAYVAEQSYLKTNKPKDWRRFVK